MVVVDNFVAHHCSDGCWCLKVLDNVFEVTATSAHTLRFFFYTLFVLGDGIGTNQNACKRLLYYVRTEVLPKAVVACKFFLAFIICYAHAVNLCVVIAVCDGNAEPGNDLISCNCSRYFKYICPYYWHDLDANIRQLACSALMIVIVQYLLLLSEEPASHCRLLFCCSDFLGPGFCSGGRSLWKGLRWSA